MSTTETPTKPTTPAKPRKAPRKTSTLQITGRSLDAALKRAKPVASKRSAVAALGGIMIRLTGGKVTLEATNMTTSVQARMSGSGTRGFTALVACDLLTNAVKLLGPGAWVAQTDSRDGTLTLAAGAKNLVLPLLRNEDFPSLDFTPGQDLMSAPGDEVLPVVRAALPFASKDQTRPALTSIVFDRKSRVVYASDSYRLGVFDCPGMIARRTGKISVPSEAIEYAAAGASKRWKMTFRGTTAVTIDVGEAVYVTRQVEGKAFEYRHLIPDDFDIDYRVPRDELVDAARFAWSVLGDRPSAPLRFALQHDKVRLHGKDKSSGAGMSMEVPAAAMLVKGSKITALDDVGLNAMFFLSAVEALTPLRGGKLRVQTISPLRPILVSGQGGRVILMPIRLNA